MSATPPGVPPGAREKVVVPVVVHVKEDDRERAARTGEQYVVDALKEFTPDLSRYVDRVEYEKARVVVE